MDPITLPAEIKDWPEAQVAAGRAPSIQALAADALATVKAQQEAIAASLAVTRAQAERDGWVDGEDALSELRSWIVEDEAEDASAP